MEREDLGALFGRITRLLIDAEQPLLAAHQLSMWGYLVLTQLTRHSAETQLALATAVGYDKTRLIGLLDELERAGLIVRKPDPNDRRAKIVCLTENGSRRHAAVRAEIRAMEEDFLRGLAPAEREALLGALPRLARPD